jgi:hypothetical protein
VRVLLSTVILPSIGKLDNLEMAQGRTASRAVSRPGDNFRTSGSSLRDSPEGCAAQGNLATTLWPGIALLLSCRII